MEQILRAHDHNQLQFWEVYSGTANLAAAMRKKGYVIFTFDLTNGWDFTKGQHRRDFYRLYYSAAPDFVWLAPPTPLHPHSSTGRSTTSRKRPRGTYTPEIYKQHTPTTDAAPQA